MDALFGERKRPQPAQAALIAIDPRTGEILAWVGGRSYNQSQYNRVLTARRQPGSVFKPFVYLAAFEKAAEEGRTDLTPATVVSDEPTTFWFEDQAYEPKNYEDTYEGPITLRRALAHSRNSATVKVAEMVGYDTVAALWKRMGTSMVAEALPVDRARVVRGHAVRDRDRLHGLPEPRPAAAAARHPADQRGLQGGGQADVAGDRRCHPTGNRVPRREHDAQRHQRGNGGQRPRPGLHARRGRQDRARPTTCATRGSPGSRRSC